MFVCLFTFEVTLNVFLPPLPKVGRPKFLEIWNPLGKVMGISGLTLLIKGVKSPRKNKFFFANLG